MKIQHSDIVVSEPHNILFLRPKVNECFSRVLEDAKIQCAFEPFDAANSADSSGKTESKLCFVALDRTQLDRAIGDLKFL